MHMYVSIFTNGKSHSIDIEIYDFEWPWTLQWPLFCVDSRISTRAISEVAEPEQQMTNFTTPEFTYFSCIVKKNMADAR